MPFVFRLTQDWEGSASAADEAKTADKPEYFVARSTRPGAGIKLCWRAGKPHKCMSACCRKWFEVTCCQRASARNKLAQIDIDAAVNCLG
jgi:hypothetical protein